jgi:flagellar biosynthesis protein FlhG
MTAALIAVASGKGGVGKTFLSIALAQSFAANSQRTLLLDGDLGLANIDVQLGVSPKGDLLSVVSGGMSLADAVTPFDGGAGTRLGFDLIAGRSGNAALRQLPAHQLDLLGRSLKLVAASYDRTIVDLGAGLDSTMLSLAAASGCMLVVLTDEPTSLTDAYALIKLTAQYHPETRIAVAVNMAADEAEGRRTHGALERACVKFLGITPPLAGIIRRDTHVRTAIRAQTPFLTRSPSAPAASDISALARQIDAAFAPPRVASMPQAR